MLLCRACFFLVSLASVVFAYLCFVAETVFILLSILFFIFDSLFFRPFVVRYSLVLPVFNSCRPCLTVRFSEVRSALSLPVVFVFVERVIRDREPCENIPLCCKNEACWFVYYRLAEQCTFLGRPWSG